MRRITNHSGASAVGSRPAAGLTHSSVEVDPHRTAAKARLGTSPGGGLRARVAPFSATYRSRRFVPPREPAAGADSRFLDPEQQHIRGDLAGGFRDSLLANSDERSLQGLDFPRSQAPSQSVECPAGRIRVPKRPRIAGRFCNFISPIPQHAQDHEYSVGGGAGSPWEENRSRVVQPTPSTRAGRHGGKAATMLHRGVVPYASRRRSGGRVMMIPQFREASPKATLSRGRS